jgi:hypothetical protein
MSRVIRLQNLLIANRGVRATARGSANICAQRMLGAHQIAQHTQRAGR